MITLSDPSGVYDLPLGTLIRAKVTATNSFGTSVESDSNNEGVIIMTIP